MELVLLPEVAVVASIAVEVGVEVMSPLLRVVKLIGAGMN